MRLVCLAALLLPTLAHAEVLAGKAGYVSEWAIKATVAAAAGQFSGPMTMTHIGLCSITEPAEKQGEIRYRVSGLLRSTMEGTLTFGDKLCAFRAVGSHDFKGAMDCPGAAGVPLSFSIK